MSQKQPAQPTCGRYLLGCAVVVALLLVCGGILLLPIVIPLTVYTVHLPTSR